MSWGPQYNYSIVSVGGDTFPVFYVNGSTYTAGGTIVNCTISVCPVQASVYGYRASLPFSSLFIALYILCLIAQVGLGYMYKTWGFMTAMVIGCLIETLGYVGRILMWQNPWADPGFILQIVLITIGPVFFSAAIYVLLAQVVKYISTSASRFPPNLFYYVLIPCDIIALILQATGGAISATSNGPSQTGVNIALAGLGFQVATLAVFILFTVDYTYRSRHIWSKPGALNQRFYIFATFVSAATLFILIRCCYRVYELSQGYSRTSTALHNQPLFIALEGVMVVIAAWCLVVAHPGRVFRRGEGPAATEERTQHEKTVAEVEAAK